MTAPTVTLTESKPLAIPALRATWRSSAEHLAEQLKRFVRLTVLSALPALSSVIFAQHFDAKTLLAFIVPIAEVAFRQVWPALGAAGADSAPGVTIVPEQVGLPAAAPVADAEPAGADVPVEDPADGPDVT